MKPLLYFISFFSFFACFATGADLKPISQITTKGSSSVQGFPDLFATNGTRTDASRWESDPETPGEVWLGLSWKRVQELQGIHLYSGYADGPAIEALEIYFRTRQGEWEAIPSASVTNNQLKDLELRFDTTVEVSTNALRLVFPDPKDNAVAIRELMVWPAAEESMPSIAELPEDADASIPKIYLNQSGFNLGKPKRFTAPTLPDGTAFGVYRAGLDEAFFTGSIEGNRGDFSDFNPTDGADYVVRAGGHTSVPFTVGLWQLERITYQNAVNFMIDSRHYVGNYTERCRGSFGWRDDHHFAWALRTLVPQYLSNPAAYERMPKQVHYETPKKGLWGALEPYADDAPDMVKLIHWGADVTVTRKTTHEFLKGELAYFLYAWPLLQKWLPQQNYDVVLSFVKENWAKETVDQEYPYDASTGHDLFALKTHIGSNKGEYPPGHNIMPNLLMYAVATRDGLPDAQRYWDATYAQVEWIIEALDWEDPLTTKGQRMSEHITMTALAAVQQLYPEQAPPGLPQKIEAWADVVIRRSANMWDFRKLTDDGQWTPSGEKRTMWNEPGNVVGLPAALLAASALLEDEDKRERLTELVWSHFDNAFGRNPCGRHFSYDAPREIEGVEHGWYSFHHGGIGKLKDARFVLDGAPKHVHYPYHPEQGDYGWTEGWIQFNTAFNLSLAYLAYDDIALLVDKAAGTIRLKAPINFDYDTAETATVQLVRNGKAESLIVKEEGKNSAWLSARGVDLDGISEVSYGYGYLMHKVHMD
jgi:hypothetical protein